MKKAIRKGIALALVGALTLSMGACGSKGKAKEESSHYFKKTYLDSVPAELLNTFGTILASGDKIYYSSYDENDNTLLYSFDIISGENQILWDISALSSEEGYASINRFCVDDSGNIVCCVDIGEPKEGANNYENATEEDVINFLVDEWGYSEEEAKTNWDEYYSEDYKNDDGTVNYAGFLKEINTEYDTTSKIVKLDENGNGIFEQVYESKEDGYSSINALACDSEGNVYVAVDEWDSEQESDEYYIDIFDCNGENIGKCTEAEWIDTMGQLGDGRVAACCYGDEGQVLSVIDPKTAKMTDTYKVGNVSQFVKYKDTKLLVNDGSNLNLYDYKADKSEVFIKWMDYDISSMDVSSFCLLSDGRVCVLSNSYNEDNNTVDIAIFEECDASEFKDVKQIKVACMYNDWEFEQKAIEFNKSQEDYHITIQEFYDDSIEDWDAMLDNFTTAVAADDDIDIVCFNQLGQVKNFASKGLLKDLYEFIDSDKELSRDTFLENILKASEYDGKLVTLPTSFTISTVLGKVSDVGTESGWTVKDMKALIDSKPEGTQLFYGLTRDEALSTCLSLGYKTFVNEDNGSCDFNNRDFMDVLEFANMFPEDFEYEDDVDETVLMNQGKVLLSRLQVGDFSEIQMYEAIYNDKLTYIGYPTTEGTGAMLSFNNMYGITKNCEDAEVAWKFLRQMYTLDDDEDGYNYGYSVRKDKYEKSFEDAASDEVSGGTYGWGEFEVEIKPATQEMIDDVKNLVANTTAVDGEGGTEMLNIIKEEAAYYFSGEQSVEDVAAKIQSRMEIYLSEIN